MNDVLVKPARFQKAMAAKRQDGQVNVVGCNIHYAT
jgi:hypothetical protein